MICLSCLMTRKLSPHRSGGPSSTRAARCGCHFRRAPAQLGAALPPPRPANPGGRAAARPASAPKHSRCANTPQLPLLSAIAPPHPTSPAPRCLPAKGREGRGRLRAHVPRRQPGELSPQPARPRASRGTAADPLRQRRAVNPTVWQNNLRTSATGIRAHLSVLCCHEKTSYKVTLVRVLYPQIYNRPRQCSQGWRLFVSHLPRKCPFQHLRHTVKPQIKQQTKTILSFSSIIYLLYVLCFPYGGDTSYRKIHRLKSLNPSA